MNISEIRKENFINLYNERGEKHGSWESYYSNGQLCSKGYYVDGKRHGLWEEEYLYTGQLAYIGYYDMGKRVSYNPDEPAELTLEEIAAKLNIPVERLKIKK